MVDLDLVPFLSRISIVRDSGGTAWIWDPVRKKNVPATKEELVRQSLILAIQEIHSYPLASIAVERALRFNKLTKRFDLLVFTPELQPYLLIECKSAEVRLDDAVFFQAAVYNQVFKAPYLMITNGLRTYCAHLSHEAGEFTLLREIPAYPNKKAPEIRTG